MAIHIKVIEDKQEEKLDYPLLMISPNNLIVRMESHGSGTVVYEGNDKKYWPLGYKSLDWAMDEFKPFHGTIELSNK